MKTGIKRVWLPLAVACIIAIAAGLVWLFGTGTVLIHDPDREVVWVELTNDSQVSRLSNLPGGLFVGLVTLEGTIQVRCQNGRTYRFGYVTSATHVRQRAKC